MQQNFTKSSNKRGLSKGLQMSRSLVNTWWVVPDISGHFGLSFLFLQRVALGGVGQVTLYQGVIPVGMPGAQHFESMELAALLYSSSFLLTDIARKTR